MDVVINENLHLTSSSGKYNGTESLAVDDRGQSRFPFCDPRELTSDSFLWVTEAIFFDDVCVDLSYVGTEDSSSSSPSPSCRTSVTAYSRKSHVTSTRPSCWSWENLSTLGLDAHHVVVCLDHGNELFSYYVYESFKDEAKIRIYLRLLLKSLEYHSVLRIQLDGYIASQLEPGLVPDLSSKTRGRVAVTFSIILSMLRTLESRTAISFLWLFL